MATTTTSTMNSVSVDAKELTRLIVDLFVAQGVVHKHAISVAEALVSAELEGVSSHGVMLVPMYLSRLHQGSVSATAVPTIVEDHGALIVMTAHHGLGQVSAQVAVDVAKERATQHAVAIVAVREAFHFGTAGYWARQLAQAGMIGFAFSNTRPLMPAPGGAQRIVGNNPLAIAFPSSSGQPLIVDMAMSATAMGKIRLAQAQERPIPEGWATDEHGRPTTSATEAIKGMLLPAAGPKGFGLAVAIDLLCGALSGGGIGATVRPLYDQLHAHYNCAHAFIAIDAARLHEGAGIGSQVNAMADEIRASPRAHGIDRVYAPGDLERARHQENGTQCVLSLSLVRELRSLAAQAGSSANLDMA